MRRLAVAALIATWLVASLAMATATSAQGKDLSGKWVVDRDKTAAANPPGTSDPVTSTELLIAMDAKTLTVLSTTRSGLVKNIYNLDGSESKNGTGASVGPGGNPAPAIISTAKWEGAVLVITTKLYQANATLKYSIDGADLK